MEQNALLDMVARNVNANASPDDPPTYPVDGLLHCSNCNTPRQCKVELQGREIVVPVLCECQQAGKDREAEAMERLNREAQVYRCMSGILEKKHREMTFQKSDKPLTFAEKYVESFTGKSKSLLLLGGCGCGKTFAAAAIANALARKGVPVLMANILYFIEKAAAFDGYSFLNGLKGYQLVVIDDFGVERRTDYTSPIVYSILETRINQELPLIMTTNLSLEQLKNPADLSERRINERIKEACVLVPMRGASRRDGIANKRFREWKELNP